MFPLGPWRHFFEAVSKSFWEIGNGHPKSFIKKQTVKNTWIVKNHWSEASMKNSHMISHTSYPVRSMGIVQYFNHHLATVTITIMNLTILYYKWSKIQYSIKCPIKCFICVEWTDPRASCSCQRTSPWAAAGPVDPRLSFPNMEMLACQNEGSVISLSYLTRQ